MNQILAWSSFLILLAFVSLVGTYIVNIRVKETQCFWIGAVIWIAFQTFLLMYVLIVFDIDWCNLTFYFAFAIKLYLLYRYLHWKYGTHLQDEKEKLAAINKIRSQYSAYLLQPSPLTGGNLVDEIDIDGFIEQVKKASGQWIEFIPGLKCRSSKKPLLFNSFYAMDVKADTHIVIGEQKHLYDEFFVVEKGALITDDGFRLGPSQVGIVLERMPHNFLMEKGTLSTHYFAKHTKIKS